MARTSKSASNTTKKTTRSKTTASKLLKSLPESVEHIEIVQQVASALEELQERVLDVKEEASKELKKLMKRYEANYKGIEKKVHQVTLEAKKQAQTSMIHLLQKWHEHKDKLPKPLAKEVEKILDQIGTKVVAGMGRKTSEKKSVKAPSIAKKKSDANKKKSAVKKRASTVRKPLKTVKDSQNPNAKAGSETEFRG